MELHQISAEAPSIKPVGASVIWTIYCHIHIESGRRYIGQTKKTWRQRWDQHVCQAKSAKNGYGHFRNAIRKYGKEAFSHQVLESCSTIEAANEAEDAWIESFSTRDPEFGFNLARGGTHKPHDIRNNPWDRPEFREANAGRNVAALMTPQARAAQKAALTKEVRSAATKAALARPDVQAKREVFQKDPAYREKISTSLKSSLASSEVREAMSARTAALHEDPEYRAAISAGVLTAFARPDVKERHRAAVILAQSDPVLLEQRRAYRASDETKKKISASSKGRKHSPEAKAKMAELARARWADPSVRAAHAAGLSRGA